MILRPERLGALSSGKPMPAMAPHRQHRTGQHQVGDARRVAPGEEQRAGQRPARAKITPEISSHLPRANRCQPIERSCAAPPIMNSGTPITIIDDQAARCWLVAADREQHRQHDQRRQQPEADARPAVIVGEQLAEIAFVSASLQAVLGACRAARDWSGSSSSASSAGEQASPSPVFLGRDRGLAAALFQRDLAVRLRRCADRPFTPRLMIAAVKHALSNDMRST